MIFKYENSYVCHQTENKKHPFKVIVNTMCEDIGKQTQQIFIKNLFWTTAFLQAGVTYGIATKWTDLGFMICTF